MSSSNENNASKSVWDQKWLPGFVFGLLALIYLLQRNPYVGFNDGLGFLYAAETGFDWATNATSHLLYNNLQHVLVRLLFFLPAVLVLTLFSIACTMGTLYMVYRSAKLLTPQRPGVAVLSVIVLGLAFTFWQQTEIIEVYAFNNLIFACYLRAAMQDLISNKRRNYLLVSILVGIGTLTHIQHILSLPFLMAYLWWPNPLTVKQKILGMLPWMALMSILFILPTFTQLNDVQSVFFESKFQGALFGVDPKALLLGLALGVAMLLYNFHLGLWVIGAGWRRLWLQDRSLSIWLSILLLPFMAFAVKYSVNDNHVFYLIPYLVLVLPCGIALESWLAKGNRRLNGLAPVGLLLPILAYGMATLIAPKVPQLLAYDHAKAYKGGVVHLLWPGKAWARDPLALAKRHLETPLEADRVAEWNYEAALSYLIFKGEVSERAAP
jgi:hypothetical protein